MSNSNYTKVSNKLVAKYGLKVAYIYAKLHYRMNLSNKHHKYYDKSHHSHYVIYKVKDLMHDCHMSRGTVIRSLKKLEKAGLIYKDRTMFCNHIYLPKFNCEFKVSSKVDKQSSKSELPLEQKLNNQDKDKYVHSSYVHVKKIPEIYPSLPEIIKKYGIALVRYAIKTYYRQEASSRFGINNPHNYVVGILRRWSHKGIKTVNNAMRSEKDSHYVDPKIANGPDIPIFKI